MEPLTEERPAAAEMPPPAPPPTPRRSPATALLVAMRPGEWVKNLLVFAGLVFSRQFDELDPLAAALLTFVAFCAVSSAGYLLNDLRDVEHDRRHHEKRRRPIAAGELSPRGRDGGGDRARRGRDRAGFRGLGGGRRPGRRLRRRDRRLLARPEAPRDRRRDDDRRPLHPARRRRRGRRRRPGLGVAFDLHRDARPLPRLHQAPPGGDAGGQTPTIRFASGLAESPLPGRCSSTTRCRSSTR